MLSSQTSGCDGDAVLSWCPYEREVVHKREVVMLSARTEGCNAVSPYEQEVVMVMLSSGKGGCSSDAGLTNGRQWWQSVPHEREVVVPAEQQQQHHGRQRQSIWHGG